MKNNVMVEPMKRGKQLTIEEKRKEEVKSKFKIDCATKRNREINFQS